MKKVTIYVGDEFNNKWIVIIESGRKILIKTFDCMSDLYAKKLIMQECFPEKEDKKT